MGIQSELTEAKSEALTGNHLRALHKAIKNSEKKATNLKNRK